MPPKSRLFSIDRFFQDLSDRWDAFWFTPMDTLHACALRALMGFGAFFFYLDRFRYFDLYYSESGMLPYRWMKELMPADYRPAIPWFELVRNEHVAFALSFALLALFLALGLGILNRAGKILLFAVFSAFYFRNFTVLYGADMVCAAWLFYLLFIPTNGYLTVLKRKGPKKTDLAGSIATRMLMLHLCIIYAYSGFEKAKGPSWWKGDAIWGVFGNGQLVPIDFGFLHHFPSVIALASFLTILWETYFPLLIWPRASRYPALLFGVALHLSIGLLMNLPFFSYFMLVPYVLFLDRVDLERALDRIQAKLVRLRKQVRARVRL